MMKQSFQNVEPDFPKRGEFLNETEFAELIGAEQPTVARFLASGVLTRGAPATQWLRELYRHYSEIAAGRRGNGPLDLVQERARLAQQQADQIEFNLRKQRYEFAPNALVGAAVATQNSIVRNRLLGLAYKVKSLLPEMPKTWVGVIDNVVREALTQLGNLRLPKEIIEQFDQWNLTGKVDNETFIPPNRKIRSRRTKISKTTRAEHRKSNKKTQRDLQSVQNTAEENSKER